MGMFVGPQVPYHRPLRTDRSVHGLAVAPRPLDGGRPATSKGHSRTATWRRSEVPDATRVRDPALAAELPRKLWQSHREVTFRLPAHLRPRRLHLRPEVIEVACVLDDHVCHPPNVRRGRPERRSEPGHRPRRDPAERVAGCARRPGVTTTTRSWVIPSPTPHEQWHIMWTSTASCGIPRSVRCDGRSVGGR